ncbi:MAG: peptidase S9 [Lysobacteraceae bacterium]|nr:MAG: peptidase S9 [Xanthomonadaceae bacterium]
MERIGLVLVTLLAFVSASHAQSNPIPFADFARPSEFSEVKISPGGEYLAVVSEYEGRAVVSVRSTSDMQLLNLVRASDRQRIGWFGWVSDDRLVVSPTLNLGWYEASVLTGELIAFDAEGGNHDLIFGYRAGQQQVGSKIKKEQPDEAYPTILDPLWDRKKEILVMTHPWESSGRSHPQAFRLNVYTGRKFPAGTSPIENPWSRLWLDQEKSLVLAAGHDEDGDYKVFHRRQGDWQLVTKYPDHLGGIKPVGLAPDGRAYIVDGSTEQTQGLALLDLESGETELLYRHPTVDVEAFESVLFSARDRRWIWNKEHTELLGVETMPGRPETHWLNPSHPEARLRRSLSAAFPDDNVSVSSQTRDGSKSVVYVRSDRNSGDYYLFDSEAKSVNFLVSARSWLDPESMAAMEPIEVTARDGTALHGYLTRPVGADEATPMVVLVHGGPTARDRWGFDSEVQMLANNGYAVLQINFRGSSGYGPAFMAAGYGQWGELTQDDITDATRWAIEQGYADADRICISGASFGAYSALMGVVREPDLYRCAIGVAGVYDLEWMHTRGDVQRTWRFKDYLANAIGTDQADLQARSPVNLAEHIKVPVFLAHGGQDERAPPSHAQAMKKALETTGKQVKWLYYSTEGHGFAEPDHRAQLYQQMVEFLNAHTASKALASAETEPPAKQ